MARFTVVLVLWLAAVGCSSHREDREDDRDSGESLPPDAGEDPRPSAGRGGSGGGGGARAGAGGETAEPDAGDAATGDACADLPDACSDEGAACSGNTLVVCAPDENGCLVSTRRNCTRGGTNFCDAEKSPPACAVDPCAALAGGCEAEGDSCSDNTLLSCRKNADGCLVATRTDCTAQSGKNTCGGDPAACRYDACRDSTGRQKSDVCATESDTCAGNYWVHCVPDTDGCPIATRTDCTLEAGKNFCNSASEPPACGFDPCKGVTNCLTVGKSCDGVMLVDCAANTDGCLVKSATDCTQNHTVAETCDAGSGTPACTTCSDAAGCAGKAEGDASCDGNVFQRCSDTDGDTCLNAVREDCGAAFTCDANPAERCVYSGSDACSSAIAASLRQPMTYGPFDTTSAGDDYSSYACEGLFFGLQATSPDLLFAIDVAPRSVATVAIDSPAGFSGNGPLLVMLTRCGDDPNDAELTAESSCESTASESLLYANGAATNTRVYLVVDANRVNNQDNVGTFGLALDVRPLVCGDGKRDGDEACDDGNLASGDGCTPACVREPGFSCTSSQPSVCTQRPTDSICANVRCPALPADAPANSQTCCTVEQRCGIAYSLFFGAACLEREQAGADDDRCTDEPSVFPTFIPALEGCCRPDGQCGLRLATGAGCVERVEAWADMTDGFGDFLYPGPFDAVSCGD